MDSGINKCLFIIEIYQQLLKWWSSVQEEYVDYKQYVLNIEESQALFLS